MANIIFGGGASFNSNSFVGVPGSPPLQASVGTVTAITVGVNTAIQNFYPFSSVQYGISPYTYSVSSGTLPTGITIDSATGLVSGIPTATQSVSNVVFRVTDSLGVVSSTTATVAFTINGTITATANSVTPVQTSQNVAITSFNPFASVAGGTLPYYYFVSSGVLPDRVTLDPTTGLVSGTPTQTYSTASVTFNVRDGGGIVASTTSTVSFTVNLTISSVAGATTTVSGYQNTAITSFNPFSSVTNGVAPYTYFVSSGVLPTGVIINSSTGQVTGTPTVTYATASVTFSVRDVNNATSSTTSTVSFTINVVTTATAGATTTVSGTQNVAITSFNPFSSVTGGFVPYTYFVSSGTLPTGININSSTGVVSGTPTASYPTTSVTFSVRDVNNVTAATTSTVSFTVPFVWGSLTSIPNALGSAVAVTVNNSGRYVVLGQQSSTTYPYYVTTTDLSTWSAATLYIVASYFAVGVASNSAGLFAVVGYDNSTGVQRADFWYSATGTSWTGPNSYGSSGAYTTAVAYSQSAGKFVAVGYTYSAPYYVGSYLTSTNGTTWTDGGYIYYDTSFQFQPVSIAVNSSGQFVAVGSGTGPYPAAASYDGSTWTTPAKMNNTTTAGYMTGVAVNSSNTWVAVGYTSGSSPDGQPLYAVSTNGTTWTTPANMNGSTVTARMQSVTCTSSGLFVAVGQDSSGAAVYATSSNGSTWTTPARINGSATYFLPKQIKTNPVNGSVIVVGVNSGQSAFYITGS